MVGYCMSQDPSNPCYQYCPCGENTIQCNSTSANGDCPPHHYCLPEVDPYQNGCPNTCPQDAECDFDQRTCTNRVLGEQGCLEDESYCYPQRDNATGCYQTCPCSPETEISCPVHVKYEPCKDFQSTCLPKTDFYGCPSTCYEECPGNFSSWTWCPTKVDDQGCMIEQECVEVTYEPGEPYCDPCYGLLECPDNSQGCQMFHVEGCPETNKVCIDNNPFLSHCPESCPMVCSGNSTYCNLGTDDEGCPLGGICVPNLGLDKCTLCPTVTCGGDSIVCPAITNTQGCSQETCSLPLAGICPEESICQPDCPFDHIPCFTPMPFDAACPQYSKTCVPAEKADGCPNFCPVLCDVDTEDSCEGLPLDGFPGCPGSAFCVPKGQPC